MVGISFKKWKITKLMKTFSICAQFTTFSAPIRLFYIASNCFSSKPYPPHKIVFKTAEVVPVFKSGSKQSLNNYRPISLLCSFSKLLEKCLLDQLYEYFKNNNFFYKHQFGFR